MTEVLRLQAPDLEFCRQTFGLYLPESEVSGIGFGELPGSLKKEIKGEINCGLSLKVTHPDLSVTFVAEFEGLDLIYFQDRNSKNRFMGEGRLYVESGEETEIPVSGYTRTSETFQRRGLGRRRLFIMNATSKARFQVPLSSSGSPKPGQRRIWERLVREEIAERHIWESSERYKFSY